jgi:hypothetical protein
MQDLLYQMENFNLAQFDLSEYERQLQVCVL